MNELFRNAQAGRPSSESKLSAAEVPSLEPTCQSRAKLKVPERFLRLARSSNFPGVNISVEEDGDCDDDIYTRRLTVFATLPPAEVGRAGLYPQHTADTPAGL